MEPRKRWMIAALVLISLFSGNSLGAQEKQIKIGLLAPLTGPNPDWGRKQVVALRMALDKINRRGGIMGTPLSTMVRDSGGNGEQAAAAYEDLVQTSKVLAVIGPLYTDEFMPVASMTNTLKTVVIATASAKPGLSDLVKRPYAFRMTVTSDKKEAPVAKAWVSTHGIKSVVVAYVRDNPVWVTMAETLWPNIMDGLNVKILNRDEPVSFSSGQKQFDAYVRKIAAYNPDGICIAAFAAEAGELIKEIRRQGLTQSILGASGIANPMIIDVAGAAAEGLWSTSLFYPDDPSPKVQAYITEFGKRCEGLYPGLNCDPEQYDLVVYDILQFLADTMKKKNITGLSQQLQAERDKIRSGLENMGVWRGTTGMMSFDAKGDGIRTNHILKVKNGKWHKAL